MIIFVIEYIFVKPCCPRGIIILVLRGLSALYERHFTDHVNRKKSSYGNLRYFLQLELEGGGG